MADTRKIEKDLFKDELPLFRDNGKQQKGTKGKNKEVQTDRLQQVQAEWVNVDMEMEKAKKKKEKEKWDDFWFKVLVTGLVIISPFIIIYKLSESLWFNLSRKARMAEYNNIQKRNLVGAGRSKPDTDDVGFFRNSERIILYVSTSQYIYPTCKISLYMPDAKADNYTCVPWEEKQELYSVRVPGTFHSIYTDGIVSELEEYEWLCKFRKDYLLTAAVPVINYASGAENYKRDAVNFIEWVWNDKQSPIDCYVELLATDEPVKGIEWEAVNYRHYTLGTFTLERGSLDSLTNKSQRMLDKLLQEYGVKM